MSAHGLPSRATLDPTGDDERLQVVGGDPHMAARSSEVASSTDATVRNAEPREPQPTS